MNRILVLDSDYPSEENLYGDVFVHTRVKHYLRQNQVKVVSFFRSGSNYVYEGVEVEFAPAIGDVQQIYNEFKPDAVFIHFYHRGLFSFVRSIDTPIVVWVHGYEALGWYRRLFNYSWHFLLRKAYSIVVPNVRQMLGFRQLIKVANETGKIHFVFVSDWMRRVSEQDALVKVKRFSVIPNPIDLSLFSYNEKNVEQRKKILILRSFDSKKYANDLSVEAIMKLSRKAFFKDLTFTIYGRGRYFQELTAPLQQLSNVQLFETYVSNVQIPGIHHQYGVFLCPTRQDAQGVSMCEAMSSGLVPVTSNNTAIPEFVQHNESGLITAGSDELALAIEKLFFDPQLFQRLSRQASASIRLKCSIDEIVRQELGVINFSR